MSKTKTHLQNKKHDIQEIYNTLHANDIFYKSTCKDMKFRTFCTFNDKKEEAITWLKNPDAQDITVLSRYNNFITFIDIEAYDGKLKNVIFVQDLKRTFFTLIKCFFEHLDTDVKVAKVEKNATLLSEYHGENLYVGHHSFIDENVVLGNDVTIMNNVTIQGNVIIGNDVFIESGTVIGACGFGYFKDKDNHSQKVPHLGRVIIGNHVFIGAGNMISRGSLNDTIIKDYVKTDNLCHIAHSSILEEGVMLAACAELSGSVKIGENTWIAPGVSIINGAVVGKNVYTGIGTNIVKDVPDGVLIYGNPGKIKEVK